jgi:RNA polymerase sigma-70 factor (ECF subfamily)
VRAGDSQSPGAEAAMEHLCRTYWYPLYCFVRRQGHSHEDASDLTQAFFALLLRKRHLKSVDVALGKFRTFLLASMKHFLANEWDKSQTLKRGGGARLLSLDDAAANERYCLEPVEQATPETLYERRWAETVVSVVLERLAAEVEENRFEALKGFLLEDKGATSFDDAAAQLGMTVAGVGSAIHRLRARFVELLVKEVENTVNTPEEAEAELRHLLASLSG